MDANGYFNLGPQELRVAEAPDDHMLPNLPGIEPSETDIKIANHIMNFIHDGCCIQLGIGGMPNAVGKAIAKSDLKNLGGHTEMFVDAYVDMIESGRMNGSMKEIDKWRTAYTFALGSTKMYNYLHIICLRELQRGLQMIKGNQQAG